MTSSLKFNLILLLSLSTMHLLCCYPVLSSKACSRDDTRCIDGSQSLRSELPLGFASWDEEHDDLCLVSSLAKRGLNYRESGKSDYCLILLNRCLAKLDGSEGLAFLKPILEKTSMKRSFRNGVGTGIKKTSFRRAKP